MSLFLFLHQVARKIPQTQFVAKGFCLTEGIDYSEMFSPVVNPILFVPYLQLLTHVVGTSAKLMSITPLLLSGNKVEEVETK